MITHGILSYVEGKILYTEVERINQWDLYKGYLKPSAPTYIYKKKYHPQKNEVGRAAPMSGRGLAIYREMWR